MPEKRIRYRGHWIVRGINWVGTANNHRYWYVDENYNLGYSSAAVAKRAIDGEMGPRESTLNLFESESDEN